MNVDYTPPADPLGSTTSISLRTSSQTSSGTDQTSAILSQKLARDGSDRGTDFHWRRHRQRTIP